MNSASLYYNELQFLAARGLYSLKNQLQWPALRGIQARRCISAVAPFFLGYLLNRMSLMWFYEGGYWALSFGCVLM